MGAPRQVLLQCGAESYLGVRDLVDVHSSEAERIRIMPTDLSSHTPTALYHAFADDEARRLSGTRAF